MHKKFSQAFVLCAFVVVGVFLAGALHSDTARAAVDYREYVANTCATKYDSSQNGQGIYNDPRYNACEQGASFYAKDQSREQCESRFGGDPQSISVCQQAYDELKSQQAPTVVVNSGGDCAKLNSANLLNESERRENFWYKYCQLAPNDYVFPDGSLQSVSKNAQVYCNYYKTPEETRFNTDAVYEACTVGYEVGFGRSAVCTKEFLLPPYAPGGGTQPLTVDNVVKVYKINTNVVSEEEQLKKVYDPMIISACQDGWTQYKVDYWYCGGNSGCQQALRIEKKRIIDPGAAPTRPGGNTTNEVNPNTPTPGAVILQTGTPTQTCGSIPTAYFSCGGGDDVGSSSFWQILEIILNILLSLVGITAVGGIVFGAMKYASAGDNSSQVNDAKNIIRNVIIGVVLFLAMWTIIQYFIPGGILS